MSAMKLMFVVFFTVSLPIFAQQSNLIEWLIKPNWILNPGAEANADQKPLQWKTDFPNNSENDWVSDYGRMSHEWNHGSLKGLPPNPGNNYFRLTVNNESADRKINIYQEFPLSDIAKVQNEDMVVAVFSGQIASHNVQKSNCTFSDIKLIFFDAQKKIIDSTIIHKVPTDFRNIDEESTSDEERGNSVLHEFQAFSQSKEVPKNAVKVRVELYCEFPCFIKNEDEEGEGSVFNTFFFDNLVLGFYRK
jgi:hypothetical protein